MRIIQWISSTWVWSSSRWIRRYVWRLHSEVDPQNWNVWHNDYDMADQQNCKKCLTKKWRWSRCGWPTKFQCIGQSLFTSLQFQCTSVQALTFWDLFNSNKTKNKLYIQNTIPLHFRPSSFSSIQVKLRINLQVNTISLHFCPNFVHKYLCWFIAS